MQKMGDRRKITKQFRPDHKKQQQSEVDEDIVSGESKMGRAKSELAGTNKESKDARKKKPSRERWLLTRKTWRYMADAGRKLIPEGVQNRPEDIPKIESYFQQVCNREKRFLLWRKSSYPGALGFRSHYRKHRNRKKGGSYREKASSADEADEYLRMGKTGIGTRESTGSMVMTPTTSGRFDLQRLRQEFLQGPSTSTTSTKLDRQEKLERPKSFLQKFGRVSSKPISRSPDIEEGVPLSTSHQDLTFSDYSELARSRGSVRGHHQAKTPEEIEADEQKEFIETLTRYLKQEESAQMEGSSQDSAIKHHEHEGIDFHRLIDQLRKNLATEFSSKKFQERMSTERLHQGGIISTRSNLAPSVHFEGDQQQQMLLATFNRYFGKTTNRQKVISDLLTDRKLLEKLYFDLRRTRGFRSRSTGSSSSTFVPQYRLSVTGPIDRRRGDDSEKEVSELEEPSFWTHVNKPSRSYRDSHMSPPPLIEVQYESEPAYYDEGTQTAIVPPTMIASIEEELRKAKERAKEESEGGMLSPGGTSRRRSSVDHDDVSPSVSDTIKRYLRMARKKSLDSDKADRFKRVNYDRNLRNIKPKGEITKPGDDDGFNKGAQTEESWIDAMRELKLIDYVVDASDVDLSPSNEELAGSHVTSSRSSVDIDDGLLSPLSPTSPPHHKSFLSSGQSFLSSLLHGLQHHQATQAAVAAGSGAVTCHSVAAGGMQKSKSSSSVMQQGKSLVHKTIFKSRSKSQTRAAAAQCNWISEGKCKWTHVDGYSLYLQPRTLQELSQLEQTLLKTVAVDKLSALNLGVNIKIPADPATSAHKPKRRAYLLKRKALTTGFFDTARSKDGDKEKGTTGGLVFGIPITQCLENDRLARRSRGECTFPGRTEEDLAELHRQSHHGSRSSFSSLIETARAQEGGSCESLSPPERMAGSVPGLLDALSYGSTLDLALCEREPGIPQIVKAALNHLEMHGLNTLGIFRVSSSRKRIRQLREEFNCGKEIVFTEDHCPHDVATLLKEFFRDLPEPLLCRELYAGFLQTQKIRNRRLQLEALQYLVQLLPLPNRDTLWVLLSFLHEVAQNAESHRNISGELVEGNKMDSNNLATLFAPNILHCIKPGSAKELSTERVEERSDVINVIRSMIDHNKELFEVPSALLDEVYLHMMDSHPDILDMLLRKHLTGIDEQLLNAVEPQPQPQLLQQQKHQLLPLESEGLPAFTSTVEEMERLALRNRNTEPVCKTHSKDGDDVEKRMWTRESFLHEKAGMGGPDVSMRPRHKDRDRGRERVSKKRTANQEDTRPSEDSPSISPRTRHSDRSALQETETTVKTRSVSVDSGHITSSEELLSTSRFFKVADDHERRQSSPVVSTGSGVITASLKIPVPGSAFALLDDVDIPYIEDNTTSEGRQQMTIVRGSTVTRPRRQRSASGSDSSPGYESTFARNTTPSLCSSSGGEAGLISSTPSWPSSPPTSPDASVSTVNYIPDDSRLTAYNKDSSSEDATQTARFSIPTKGSVSYQRGTSKEATPLMLQKVTFTSTSELQQVRRGDTKPSELPKSAVVASNKKVEFEPERDRKLATSISSIGGAVMRSKTADIERMLKIQKDVPSPKIVHLESLEEKKKYTKRRYTDYRHQTRHIPDAESLQTATTATNTSSSDTATAVRTRTSVGPVWKRRELIASDPKEHETFS